MRRAAHNRRRRSPRTGGPPDPALAPQRKRSTAASASSSIAIAQPARFRHPPGIEQQARRIRPSSHGHAARAPARRRAGDRAADRCRPAGRLARGRSRSSARPAGGVAERADQPQSVARPAARAIGHVSRRPGRSRSCRAPAAPGGKRDRVAADQRQAVAFARRLDAVQESLLPLAGAADRQRQQRRRRVSRPSRQGRTGSPRPASSRRSPAGRGQEMHALGDAVVGDDQPVEHRDIVEQPARFRAAVAIRRRRSMTSAFAHGARQRSAPACASLAMASSRPFTKPLSRLS